MELVEETPIPETSYPCIFSREWLEEINQGRHGTPLRQCLLASGQGVVRLPWERVFVPEFVDLQTRSSMASAPPSCPPLPLPRPPPLPRFPENSSSDCSFPLSASNDSATTHCPVSIKNSILTSSHPSTFSVETRICPAKHGIAVSLCLVDTRAASSSRPAAVRETEAEPRPVGLVSPSKWDSGLAGSDAAVKASALSGPCPPATAETRMAKGEDRSVIVADNLEKDKNKIVKDITEAGSADGEYIDIMQATMLFGRAQPLCEEQHKEEAQTHAQMEQQMRTYPHRQPQRPPHTQTESHRLTQRLPNTQAGSLPQSHALPAKPQTQSCSTSGDTDSLWPNTSAESGPPATLRHSQPQRPHPDGLAASPCVRTVRFSDKPCTPCMRRRQGEKVSRAQELRCRYRDSYQAAIQNPVAFGRETERGNMLALVEEDGDLSQCDDRAPETGCNAQGMWFDPATQHRGSVSEAVCEESGEKSTVPYWRQGDTNTSPCTGYKGTGVLNVSRLPEQTTEKNVQDSSNGDFHGTNFVPGTRINTRGSSSSSDPQQSPAISAKHHRLPFTSGEIPAINVAQRPFVRQQNKYTPAGASPDSSKARSAPPQHRRDSVLDGRCSSLSTAVVDTSEKCELVLVEGQNVRRRENSDSCAEIPQLHVVKCKNSTAFRLVSPKINRKKLAIPGTEHVRCLDLIIEC